MGLSDLVDFSITFHYIFSTSILSQSKEKELEINQLALKQQLVENAEKMQYLEMMSLQLEHKEKLLLKWKPS